MSSMEHLCTYAFLNSKESAAWLVRHPGLEGVLKAVKMYRLGVQDKIAPKMAFNDDSWLGL